jgi:hypothetical protein
MTIALRVTPFRELHSYEFIISINFKIFDIVLFVKNTANKYWKP